MPTKNSSSITPRSGNEDWQLKAAIIERAQSGAPRPRKGTRLGDALIRFEAEEDSTLMAELLVLAKSGAPRPKKGTRLGDALIRFTTPPAKEPSAKRTKLRTFDELQVAEVRKRERQEVAARGIKRQRPNYLAKGERHSRA